MKRLTPQDYHDLATARGYEWLGPEVSSVSVKTYWRCDHNHEWETRYATIQQGFGCPHCARNVPIAEQDYRALATKRGFEWLGPMPVNVQTKTLWRCPNGHEFENTYSHIRIGNGCLYCSTRRPKIAWDYCQLADQAGIFWIGKMPATVSHKTLWQCQQGHKFECRYNDIQQGIGCPLCLDFVNGNRVSKVQRRLHEMIGGELNYQVGRKGIDIALTVEGVRIDIEYDAAYWHNTDRDAKRDAYFIARGWRILRVKSENKLPAREQLDAAITRLVAGDTYAEIVLDDWKG